tara:strand:+ start:1509 stop:2018 length:510 start_codon:yes stop_codon:yes gene_type:complete
MAFIRNGTELLSFAEYQDVVDASQRLFDTNEGLTEEVVENHLIRATERILTQLRSTNWWRGYYVSRDNSTVYRSSADIPALNANNIIARTQDFTELCVTTALGHYILPTIADFGTEDNAERQQMSYYVQRASDMFDELVAAGDWYDFDADGIVASAEKDPGIINLKRVR